MKSDKQFLDYSTIDALVAISARFCGIEDRQLIDGFSEGVYDLFPAMDLITCRTHKHFLYETKPAKPQGGAGT